ncbi:MAG: cytochrome c-type biogenesis protein CcmH, partial [Solirubrobacterales bacterium]
MIQLNRRRIVLVVAIAICALAAGASLASACPVTSLPAIENEVMCPICGVPLVNAGGPQAENEREFIRDLVDKCATKQQIKTALISEYGEEILAMPSGNGFGLAAYLVPIFGILLAAAGAGAGAVRWRRTRAGET